MQIKLNKNTIFLSLLLVIFCSPLRAEEFYSFSSGNSVIGKMKYYEVKEGESLIEIARIFNLGYNEIADANPGTDPFVPMPGNRVKIPTIWILPERKPSTGIVINLSEMRLYYFFKKEGRSFVKTYPVGIGDEGSETPAGFFRITHKIENPSWRVPESIRKEKPWLPPVVPPGPDNPLGSHALRLSSGSILIHGTDRPWGIGRQVSHGCIRLYPEDIVKLFYEVKIGTQVFIVREPIKIGIKEKEIYIEIHKDPISGDMNYYDEAIRMLVKKNLISYIELDRLYEVIKRKDGIPVKIGRLTEEQSPPKNKSYERAIVH